MNIEQATLNILPDGRRLEVGQAFLPQVTLILQIISTKS